MLKFGEDLRRFRGGAALLAAGAMPGYRCGMGLGRFIGAFVCALTLVAMPAAAANILFAGGQWAAIDRGSSCEAASRALRIATGDRVQAVAGFAFDAQGPRNGQFFARLSRVPRDGSSVMLTVGRKPFLLVSRGDWAWSRGPQQEAAIIDAVRAAGGMRIDSRDRGGRRFVDRYLLEGAPTAIDAAAAACSLRRR